MQGVDIYDEFGNYIGPDIPYNESQEDEDEEFEEETADVAVTDKSEVLKEYRHDTLNVWVEDESSMNAVVPFEEKKIYPDASEVYPDAEVLIQEEDTQPLTTPILMPVRRKDFDLLENIIDENSNESGIIANFSFDFLAGLMYEPSLVRNICIVGSLHHGKSTFVTTLVNETHTRIVNENNMKKPENDLNNGLLVIQNKKKITKEAKSENSMKIQNEYTKLNKLKKSISAYSRYTDTRIDEQCREISVKSIPLSLVLNTPKYYQCGRSYLFNIFDTPGHVDFHDEIVAALALCDGAVIVVDVLEGLSVNCERMLKTIIKQKLPIILLLNKIDRLILELRLPPQDAFYKIRYTIQQLNLLISNFCSLIQTPNIYHVSPLKGNVCFASATNGFCFTIDSFAQSYFSLFQSFSQTNDSVNFSLSDPETFARALWGDVYYNPDDGTFSKNPVSAEGASGTAGSNRTFVQFILLPLYKLFGHCISDEKKTLMPILSELGIHLKNDDYNLDTRPLVQKVCRLFFGGSGAFVHMVIKHIPDPRTNARNKVCGLYTGYIPENIEATDDEFEKSTVEDPIVRDMFNLNRRGNLMVYTTKNYHKPDCNAFDVFGRVFSGTIKVGQRVKVLGESYSLSDGEDAVIRTITDLWIYEARYKVAVNEVPAGNWVLIGGIDGGLVKTSTLIEVCNPHDHVCIFSPLRFHNQPIIKVACEPLNPSELPKMLAGLRRIDKAYPMCVTRVEESGEHIILGNGEMYMDCVLHDLRRLYGDLEIKVADPVVQFSETVVETSAMKCFAETPNKRNKLYMIAEPLEKGIGEDIENGLLKTTWDSRKIADTFMSRYDWDALSARSIWAFGPDETGGQNLNIFGCNILADETLPYEVDKDLLESCKDYIIQGFKWATKEGPLIEQPMRNVKFKLLDAHVSHDPICRGGGQIIPTARRVAYSAFLLATPRLMEPVVFSEIQCPADCVAAIYTVLSRRRGYVTRDFPKPGTPLYIVHACLPAIEAFGFETDLRTHTSGQAFCMSMYDHWALVPGDPLDKSIVLRPLEPAPAPHLSREFLLKTRRRKGLSEDVSVHKFFDDPMLIELARQDAELHHTS